MTEPQPARRYRFGVFEVDAAVGELRRQGIRVKLNAQPFQVLLMLLERPGELLTRDQIASELWIEGTFVDYEHGLNSAMNRIREALGDTASNPRFVETLARRGYRFVAPVERIMHDAVSSPQPQIEASVENQIVSATTETQSASWMLASPHELPRLSRPVVQSLFIAFQFMYLAFYVGALANLPEIEDLLSSLPRTNAIYLALIVSAAILIPVRAFVLTAVLFHAPRTRENLLKLWRFLLPLDELWALSPFLLLHHINFGLALSCTALLVYSPFVQRSLILMGAGASDEVSIPVR
jgi:cholera toxin transcriptional activator